MRNSAEWKDLVGRKVRVQKDGHIIRTGYVEDVTTTADALWIAAHGAEQRVLYEKAQGHTVLLITGHEVADSRLG